MHGSAASLCLKKTPERAHPRAGKARFGDGRGGVLAVARMQVGATAPVALVESVTV